MKEIKDKLKIATYKDINLIFNALTEIDEKGKLSEETKRKIKVYNDYYKEGLE